MGIPAGKRIFRSLKSLKREKMRIAKDLGYSEECYMKIYNAKTSNEIDSILRQERLSGD